MFLLGILRTEIFAASDFGITASNTADGVRLVWNGVGGAEGYSVYRRPSGGEWTELAAVSGTEYTDTSAENGRVYYYSVMALGEDDVRQLAFPAVIERLEPPRTSATNGDMGVVVRWADNPSALSYAVYRRESGGKWEKLGEEEICRWADGTAESGVSYCYGVRAVGSRGESALSQTEDIVRLGGTELSAENGKRGATVRWDGVPGAESYRLYRRIHGGSWQLAAETEKTQFSDESMLPGVEYEYCVRSYAQGCAGCLSGEISALWLETPELSAENAEAGICVRWTPVSGAERYEVARRVSESRWAEIGVSDGAEFTDQNVFSGRDYEYRVRAAVSDSYSGNSEAVEVRRIASLDIELENTVSGVRISWNAAVGAWRYRVWRYDGKDRTLIAETAQRSWCDGDVESGSSSAYAVTAYSGGSESAPLVRKTVYLSPPRVTAREVMAGAGISWTEVSGAEVYTVFRRTAQSEWEEIASVPGRAYTDTSFLPGKELFYAVRADAGEFSSSLSSCRAEAAEGIPEETGFAPEGFEKFSFGQSGSGKTLWAYRHGNGENSLFMTFCVHGYEDNFAADGRALVYTAFRLMEDVPSWASEGWSIYVLPCCNPDGLIDGTWHNGMGRCTTTMFDESGELTDSAGVDINRCFPTAWKRFYSSRNYNGKAPLACAEAVALGELLEKSRGSGRKVFIDVHGWTTQTITSDGEDGALFRAFEEKFPENTWAYTSDGEGYISAYAETLGYESCLFEFPDTPDSLDEFLSGSYTEDFTFCVRGIVEGR